jgi:hypothetical protein
MKYATNDQRRKVAGEADVGLRERPKADINSMFRRRNAALDVTISTPNALKDQ